jgi:hypothetical protein
MATSSRLNLTRDQLATFLKDHEQIRQFEKLFSTVGAIAPDFVNEVFNLAANADAKAIQALGQIAEFAQAAAVCCAVTDRKATEALDTLTTLQQETAVAVTSAENKAQQALQEAEEAIPTARAALVEAGNAAAAAQSALAAVARLADDVGSMPPPREFKRSRYGSFYDTTTQSALVINTATTIKFNTTDLSHGVYIGTPTSRIYVDTDGIYNFQTSIQLDSTVATAEEFYLWFSLNGTDVSNSASQVRTQGNNAEVFVSLNYFFNLKAGDYVELVYSVSNLGVQLLAAPAAAPHPGIPSVILTVANNIQGVQ